MASAGEPVETGFVLIGRNEGDRLKAAIRSLLPLNVPMVYVDSGSTDGSVEFAKSVGVITVPLNLDVPFTAARARNAGFAELLKRHRGLAFVHFMDGDCILEPGWLDKALQLMRGNSRLAVVCGIRKELDPSRSIYNWMCDIEWNQPEGEATACGGDALFRVTAFQEANGYNPNLLAGEEPELCLRLREKGWTIWRSSQTMTRHDAAITRFSQFWKRGVRSGYGQAKVALIHRNSDKNIWFKESVRPLAYAMIPILALVLAFFFGPWGLAPLIVFPVQIARIARRMGPGVLNSWRYGLLITVAKFAETQGTLALLKDVVFGKQRKIIEYK
jgi:cellulose synthase/poly-beta-1,6-N-acetylglucosamine synthase-like glycosyltransferase